MTSSGFKFDNTYLHLPKVFYTKLLPTPVPKPEMVILNEPLATDLCLDFSDKRSLSFLMTLRFCVSNFIEARTTIWRGR